jgi:hypothetical protein
MGMDAHLYVTKYVSDGRYFHSPDGEATYVINPVYGQIVQLVGAQGYALTDHGILSVDVPVAYFRKDYDLHEWIAERVVQRDGGARLDPNGGGARLTLQDIKDALEFAQEFEQYHPMKADNAIKMLQRAIASGETSFQYSAG